MMKEETKGSIAFGGGHSGGGEIPMSVFPVIEHFNRASYSVCWTIASWYIQSMRG